MANDNTTIALRQIIENLGTPTADLARLADEYDEKVEEAWSAARERGWQARATCELEKATRR